jgi:hypothetical protein
MQNCRCRPRRRLQGRGDDRSVIGIIVDRLGELFPGPSGIPIVHVGGILVREEFGCACRKLNPGILVMQSAQGWATKNVLGAIDGARDRCIFLQG